MDSSQLAVFDLLPDEDVTKILSKIENLNDLFSLCRTSTRIAIICQDSVFWKNKYKQDFGDKYLPEGDLKLPYIIRTKAKESNLLSVGYDHAGMVDKNGVLFMWGNNKYGQLGDGTNLLRLEPVKIHLESKVICISCGHQYTAAVTEKGEVLIWGDRRGKIPKKANIPDKIIKISINKNTIALSENGLVYHWRSGKPELLLTDIRMIDIAATDNPPKYLMISEDMKLYRAWILRRNFIKLRMHPTPEQILIVSNGGNYTGLLSVTGNVYLRGKNDAGQLGVGYPGVYVTGHNFYNMDMIMRDFNKISLESPIILLSCRHSTTAVITLNNKLYMWGSNLGNKIFIEKYRENSTKTYQELYPKGYFLAEPSNSPYITIIYNDLKIRLIPSILGNPTVNHTRMKYPSLTIPTQIDIGYPIVSISIGENVSFAKTADGRLNRWGKLNS